MAKGGCMKTTLALVILLASTGTVMAQTTYVQPQPGAVTTFQSRLDQVGLAEPASTPRGDGGYSVQEPLGRPYVGTTEIDPTGDGGFIIRRPLGADD